MIQGFRFLTWELSGRLYFIGKIAYPKRWDPSFSMYVGQRDKQSASPTGIKYFTLITYRTRFMIKKKTTFMGRCFKKIYKNTLIPKDFLALLNVYII